MDDQKVKQNTDDKTEPAEETQDLTMRDSEPTAQEEKQEEQPTSEIVDQEETSQTQNEKEAETTSDKSTEEPSQAKAKSESNSSNEESATDQPEDTTDSETPTPTSLASDDPSSSETSAGRWYVVHTYAGHENRVAAALKQRVESEGLADKILDVLVPTQEKIEIRGGKKETVKEKIFPGYILVKMVLDDNSWLAIRTTQGVTSFVGAANKPTPIPEVEVQTIVKFMQQGAQPTYKQVIAEGDTVKIIDGPFADMIGKCDEVDKERGKVKVMVSIFGRETPVELDFLQVAKL